MLKIKGAAVRNTVNHIRDCLGDRFESFQASLDPGTADLLTLSCTTYDFVDVDRLVTLMDGYARFTGKNPETLYHEFGRVAAEYGLNSGLRFLFKMGSPYFLIKKGPLVWKSYFSQGIFEVDAISPVSATVRVRNAEIPHEAICARISGWIERTAELAGASNVSVHHARCFKQGHLEEEWRGHWSL